MNDEQTNLHNPAILLPHYYHEDVDHFLHGNGEAAYYNSNEVRHDASDLDSPVCCHNWYCTSGLMIASYSVWLVIDGIHTASVSTSALHLSELPLNRHCRAINSPSTFHEYK